MTACEHCGHPPSYKAREALQQPYIGMWQALCAWEQQVHDRGDPIYPRDLRREVYRIADMRPDAQTTFAVNTTRVGRPLNEVTETLL